MLRAASLLLSAIGCSIVIAFGLTVLSEMTLGRAPVEDQSRPNSRAVFSLDYGSRLNDENLVDYMATLRLSTGIRMIDWVDPFLYIDLYVKDDQTRRDQVFADVKDIIDFSLLGMKNVENVYVRVYEARNKGSSLLLAVSADAQQLQRLREPPEAAADEEAEQYVRERFRVQQTSHWIERFERS